MERVNEYYQGAESQMNIAPISFFLGRAGSLAKHIGFDLIKLCQDQDWVDKQSQFTSLLNVIC